MGYWERRWDGGGIEPIVKKQCGTCSSYKKQRCSITGAHTEKSFQCNMCDHKERKIIASGYNWGSWKRELCKNCGATRETGYTEGHSCLGD